VCSIFIGEWSEDGTVFRNVGYSTPHARKQPKRFTQHSEQDESLKSRKKNLYIFHQTSYTPHATRTLNIAMTHLGDKQFKTRKRAQNVHYIRLMGPQSKETTVRDYDLNFVIKNKYGSSYASGRGSSSRPIGLYPA
jgi:hypothetical protein